MITHSLYQAIITPQDTLDCPLHSQPLTNFHYDSTSARLVCPECINAPNFDSSHLIKTHFQAYNNPKAYVISLLNISEPHSNHEKTPLDFQNCQLEHIIVVQHPNSSDDTKAQGYYPRSLVYIPEKKLLVAGSLDGYLYFWSMGTTVEFTRKINISQPIKFLKYIDLDEKGKCLVIGANSFVHFYDLEAQEPKYLESMTCGTATNDLCYISHQRKLITVGRDGLIRFWSLEDSVWKGEKVPQSYGVQGEIFSVEYIKDSNCLALETNSGLKLLDLDKREFRNTKEVFVDVKRGFSLGYLPKADQMLLFKRDSGLNVLDAKDFRLLYEYPGFKPIGLVPGLKFIANEDESQFMSNGNGSCAYICDDKTTNRLDMTGLATKTSAIEVLHDQNRFVIADQHRGTLFVFRTNVEGENRHKVEKGTLERITVEDQEEEEFSEDLFESPQRQAAEEPEGIEEEREKISLKKTPRMSVSDAPKMTQKTIQNLEKKRATATVRMTRAAAKPEKRVTRSTNSRESSSKRKVNVQADRRGAQKLPEKFTKKSTPRPKNGQTKLKPVKMQFVLPVVMLKRKDLVVDEEENDDRKLKRINMKFILPTNKILNSKGSVERSRSKSKSPSLLKRTEYGRGKRSRDKNINYKD